MDNENLDLQKDLISPQSLNHDDFEKKAQEDIQEVQRLFKQGKLSVDEAQEYMGLIRGEIEKIKIPKKDALSLFEEKMPMFFQSPERKEVLDYLKTSSDEISGELLEKISGFISKIESGAVEKYKNTALKGADSLSVNDAAKLRLSSIVSGGQNPLKTAEKTFSRKEIALMSNDDFLKYEKIIERQMAEGKIK
jgi:hypothetical protein